MSNQLSPISNLRATSNEFICSNCGAVLMASPVIVCERVNIKSLGEEESKYSYLSVYCECGDPGLSLDDSTTIYEYYETIVFDSNIEVAL